jgi:PII-like signaling protein
VNEDCLKLTTYFSERDRSGGQLLADRLLDLYGRHGVHASILLRGIAGFGGRHHPHTDRLLSLSEDLPIVAVAVDARARIEEVVADARALEHHGLLTLERARLLSGEEAGAELPPELGDEIKLTAYVGRQDKVGRAPAFVAICDLLRQQGLAGATVLLGVDGTRDGVRARARFLGKNSDVPMMVIAIGPTPTIAAALPGLGEMVPSTHLTLERVTVCKRDGELLSRPVAPDSGAGPRVWQKLMIYSSERARHGGHPLHRALVARLLRESSVSGATSVRGIWGFHGDHEPHGDKLLQVHRQVPVVTIVIDSPERITDSFKIVDEVTSGAGLVTSELVPAVQ